MKDGFAGVQAQLADCQVFKDPLFDLLQAVMVAVENLACFDDIQAFLVDLAPGHLEKQVQIVAQDRSFRIAGRHAGQAADFLG